MNDTRYDQCRALYDLAFPGEPAEFTKALFDRYYPDHTRVICEEGRVVAMLFSIPSPIQLENGTLDARYLYAVATHPDHRGKGLAKQLLAAEAAAHPVFLRPMSSSLFDFYGKAGYTPISPVTCLSGKATAPTGRERKLTATAYLALRDEFAFAPFVRPTADFLSLYELGGGFVAYGLDAVALYEKHGDKIWFKEYWGDTLFAPRLASFLGGTHFELRFADPDGEPFGMAVGVPADTAFLAAMD
ncbi:MAG: GNAT family N-acetyltransferase [Clostridia bacterium]|nr:GNAT family N-acetyltransferase [Clostridia bacterium]